MISRLKLLQSKYSLSNEFMVRQLQSEIERQALMDIKGVINNCSVSMIENAIGSFADNVGEPVIDVAAEPVVTSPSEQPKRNGKKRR